MKDFWNSRFAEDKHAYGTEPNEYLTQQGQRLQAGMEVLVIGDGQGRNGVWLAEQGLNVTSVDYSQAGVDRATKLASERGVSVNTICADLTEWPWPQQHFDLVVSIYVHFPPVQRPLIHKQVIEALKPNGIAILEGFSKEQLNYKSGGPPVEEMLFSVEELKQDFKDLEILELEQTITLLDEGPYHSGDAAVVRMVGRK